MKGITVTDQWNFRIPHSEGVVTRQAHVDPPEGSFEREMGRDGFFGAASHVYHRNPPTAWESFAGNARPRAFKTSSINERLDCPWDAARILGNTSCKVRFWRSAGAMSHLVRNADGDDLLFVHRGGFDLFCDYGHIALREGDYFLIPRGTMWRVEGDGDILMVEATDLQYRLPDRGLLGRHSLFDPGMLARPQLDDEFRRQKNSRRWEVRVKRRGELSHIVYPFNPLDAIGWKGDLYPVRLNIADFCPVTSHRLALPPSVHVCFETSRYVVCSIVPRPFETEPRAMKLPWFHNNDDFDEVMFLHRGNFSSRGSAIGQGDMTFHPSGGTHGPHPEVLRHMFDAKGMFEGWLVMIDSRDALEIDRAGKDCEAPDYGDSWRGAIAFAPDVAE